MVKKKLQFTKQLIHHAQNLLYCILEVSVLSRVNCLRNRERDSLKGWLRTEVYSDYIKSRHAKSCPEKSGLCGLERDLCVHQSSLQVQCHHFHRKETRRTSQDGATVLSVWTIKEQGPLCVLLTQSAQSISYTHTLGLTSRAPSGNASLLKGLLAEDQMEADFLQAGTESLRWHVLCSCTEWLSPRPYVQLVPAALGSVV